MDDVSKGAAERKPVGSKTGRVGVSKDLIKEISLAAVFFVFVCAFFIDSFSYPRVAARLPEVVCAVTLVLLAVHFVKLWKRPESAAAVGRNRFPKRLLATIGALAVLPIIWHFLGYVVAVIVMTEGMLLLLGVRNKIALVVVPLALAFSVYLLFTKVLYIQL